MEFGIWRGGGQQENARLPGCELIEGISATMTRDSPSAACEQWLYNEWERSVQGYICLEQGE